MRTREKAIRQLVKEAEERMGDSWENARIGVLHVDNPTGARHLTDLLKERYPGINPEVGQVGPVLGSHAGPGATAIVIKKDSPF